MRICDEIELELSAYCDGELPPAERQSVESHLAVCATCKTSVEEIERVRSVLSSLPKVAAPVRAKVAIRASVESELKSASKPVAASVTSIQHGRRSNGWIWFASAAAAVMISALGYVSFFHPSIPAESESAPIAFKPTSVENKREARRLERSSEASKAVEEKPTADNVAAEIRPDGATKDLPDANPFTPIPMRKSPNDERAGTLTTDDPAGKKLSSTAAAPAQSKAALDGVSKDKSTSHSYGGGSGNKNAAPVFKQQDAVVLKKVEAQRPLSPPAPAPFATAPPPRPIAPKGESDKGGSDRLRMELPEKAKAEDKSIDAVAVQEAAPKPVQSRGLADEKSIGSREHPLPGAVRDADAKEGGDAMGRKAGNGLPSAKKRSTCEELEALRSGTKSMALPEERKAPQKPGHVAPEPPAAAFPVPSVDRANEGDKPLGASNRRASPTRENTQLCIELRGKNLFDVADSIRQRVLVKDASATFLEVPLVPYPISAADAAYAVTINAAQTDAVMSALQSMQSATKPTAKIEAKTKEFAEKQNEQSRKLAAPHDEKRTGRVMIRIEIVIEK